MLASKFLSVEMGNERSSNTNDSESESSSMSCDDTVNNNLYNELELSCKLPKVLLSECTISLASSENKKKDGRKLRFEATVIPVKVSSNVMESDPEPAPPEMMEVIQGVQAVYSDDENNSAEILPKTEIQDTGSNTKCGICGKEFYKSLSLVDHLKSQCCASDETSRGFTCQVCGRTYTQRSVLKKHAAVHTGYRQPCKLCGLDFTQRSSLLRHCKRIHGLRNDAEIEKAAAAKQLSMGSE